MGLGTELINEPFPGADWETYAVNAAGCPDLEQQRLLSFYRTRADARVQEINRKLPH